ncbi:MAG: topoisomerase [Desulfotalea sp.]|nr:MAG: topoisomerase [Desulfotalea sp.]
MGTFKTLSKLNVNDKVEKKSNLSYLSWAWAWAKVKDKFPEATYQIWKDEKGNPYTFDETLGYMCYTAVCIEGETLEMWLPVMNGANKAMRKEDYTYTTKSGKKTVEAATMFDINKTIMRCLVKNLAMFGLGLYIYAGEDLPEVEPEPLQKMTKDIAANNAKAGTSLKTMLTTYEMTPDQQTKYEALLS